MPTPPADTIAGAYELGLAEGSYASSWTADGRYRADTYAPRNLRPSELRDAVDSWTAAQGKHEETSYYGAFHIRAMRAYWLGRLRAARAREQRLEELARHSAIASALARPVHAA